MSCCVTRQERHMYHLLGIADHRYFGRDLRLCWCCRSWRKLGLTGCSLYRFVSSFRLYRVKIQSVRSPRARRARLRCKYRRFVPSINIVITSSKYTHYLRTTFPNAIARRCIHSRARHTRCVRNTGECCVMGAASGGCPRHDECGCCCAENERHKGREGCCELHPPTVLTAPPL